MVASPERIAGRFEIQAEHRSGGMGTVYRAQDTHTGAVIALKLFHGRTHVETERFVREAGALAGLTHPAIVKYVAHGVLAGGTHYLAMEWLEGETLAEHLARGPLSVADTLALAGRVAGALAEAHRHGVVHRDIKPANLLLEGGQPARVKVLDFGVALTGREVRPAASITMPVGTPGYMAPEQARGQTQPGPAVDVFALGCVLHECLTGRPAFASEHLMGLLAKILVEDAAPLGTLRDDVPAALEALVAGMLHKNPASRPTDGAALVERIAAVQAQSGEGGGVARLGDELRLVSMVLAGPPPGGGELSPQAEELLRAAVAAFGARVESLADGSVLVLIGGQGGAIDQAARAAHSALALRDVVPGRRLYVTTGRLALRGDDGALPVGDVIERGVKAMTRLPADAVGLDEASASMLAGRFELDAGESGLALLVGVRSDEAPRTLLGRPTHCVGRERELSLLEETYRECRDERVARAVLVTGGPGIGKTRLLAELFARVDARSGTVPLVISGRGDPMAAGSPFGLLAPALRRAVGIHGGEPLELRQAKVTARVAACLPPRPAARVAAFLGELASVPFPDDDNEPLRAARSDTMLMGDAMRGAWEEWLAAEAHLRPVVIVLDDLHWGDLPTVRFVDAALRALADAPLFVLAMARPEVQETFPHLWRDRALQQLRLAPLTKRAAQALVSEVLGDGVDRPTAERLVERAEGNPFFLEELMLTVASGGPQLPETVIGTVQGRLDALAPAARRVLRAASVFGQSFGVRGVAAVLGDDDSGPVREWLDDLVRREILVRRAPGSQLDELGFRHELVREAAYAMLPPADRRQGHLVAAEWLEWLGETDAVILGEHFERGGEITRAAAWYRRGAEQALGASDLHAAVARAELGIALVPDGDPLGALLLVKAEALRWLGEPLAAERHATMALERLTPGTTPWFQAAGELLSSSARLGNLELVRQTAATAAETIPFQGAEGARAISLCRAAEQLLAAGEHGAAGEILAAVAAVAPEDLDKLAQARMMRVLARRDLFRGDIAGYLGRQEAAVRALDQAGDHRGACSARSDLGVAHASLGDHAVAEALLDGAIESAERMGLVHVAAWSQAHRARVLLRRGQRAQAAQAAQRAIELAIQHRDRRLEGTARMHLGAVRLADGDVGQAEKEARAAADLLAITPPRRAAALTELARALGAQRRFAEARATCAQATSILTELGGLDEDEISVRLVHAETLWSVGEIEGARRALATAVKRLGENADRITDARLRELYLSEVPDHARALSLAAEWGLGE